LTTSHKCLLQIQSDASIRALRCCTDSNVCTQTSIRHAVSSTSRDFILLDKALVLSITSNGESSFMAIQTSVDEGIFILSVWVSEHEHLSSTLSLNFKHAHWSGADAISHVLFAFSCGRWNCVVLNNGTIIASNNGNDFVMLHDASVAAMNAFVFDPRCSSGRIEKKHVFTVRNVWMGDGEVILHWGGGCYVALEIVMDRAVPRVVISWAACVGTDFPRAPKTVHSYLGAGSFAVVSAVFEGSPACVEDGTPVPRNLVTAGFPSICDETASSSVHFSEIAADMLYGELFLKSNETLNTMNSSVFALALFKIPWRQQFSWPARHVSDSNISFIPNMIQTRPMCQLTGVVATTGWFDSFPC
jgi:hypothetical protein